jgi:hypothetical protein
VSGPQYLFCGSRLTDDTLVLRILLEGLNTQARQWSETITIQHDGSLKDLQFEVEMFKHLRYRHVEGWEDPNVVIAFMDRLSHNRGTGRILDIADEHGRPWFIVSGERIAP